MERLTVVVPESRRAAIGELWAPDGAEFVEGTRFSGLEKLDARIDHAYQQFVASGRYAVTAADDVARHDDIVTFTIQLTAPGRRGRLGPVSSCCLAATASSKRTTN